MLFHFQIDLSHIDRGIYETLSFRTVQHPSEAAPYLLTRVLAYALSYQENLEFSPAGLGDPDSPALLAKSAHGTTELWIEIGNPSAKKLHKASKASKKVIVYTYKNPEILIQEMMDHQVHRASEIEVYAFDPKFLHALEGQLKKNSQWSVLYQQGHLDVGTGVVTPSTDVRCLQCP